MKYANAVPEVSGTWKAKRPFYEQDTLNLRRNIESENIMLQKMGMTSSHAEEGEKKEPVSIWGRVSALPATTCLPLYRPPYFVPMY